VNWILSQKVTLDTTVWSSPSGQETFIVKNLAGDFQDGVLINELAIRLLQNVASDFVPAPYRPHARSDKFRISNYNTAYEMFRKYVGLDLSSVDPTHIINAPSTETILSLLDLIIKHFHIGDSSCTRAWSRQPRFASLTYALSHVTV